MSDFYKEMQGVAAELLSEFKQGTIFYRAPGTPSGDDWNPIPAVPVDYPLDATANGVGAQLAPNSLVREGDTLITTPPFGVTPDLTGIIIKDGEHYQVVKVQSVPDAGEVIVWRIWARK